MTTHPRIEFFKIYAGLASPVISVSVVADGKNLFFSGNRKTILKILAEATAALHNMEPGE